MSNPPFQDDTLYRQFQQKNKKNEEDSLSHSVKGPSFGQIQHHAQVEQRYYPAQPDMLKQTSFKSQMNPQVPQSTFQNTAASRFNPQQQFVMQQPNFGLENTQLPVQQNCFQQTLSARQNAYPASQTSLLSTLPLQGASAGPLMGNNPQIMMFSDQSRFMPSAPQSIISNSLTSRKVDPTSIVSPITIYESQLPLIAQDPCDRSVLYILNQSTHQLVRQNTPQFACKLREEYCQDMIVFEDSIALMYKNEIEVVKKASFKKEQVIQCGKYISHVVCNEILSLLIFSQGTENKKQFQIMVMSVDINGAMLYNYVPSIDFLLDHVTHLDTENALCISDNNLLLCDSQTQATRLINSQLPFMMKSRSALVTLNQREVLLANKRVLSMIFNHEPMKMADVYQFAEGQEIKLVTRVEEQTGIINHVIVTLWDNSVHIVDLAQKRALMLLKAQSNPITKVWSGLKLQNKVTIYYEESEATKYSLKRFTYDLC